MQIRHVFFYVLVLLGLNTFSQDIDARIREVYGDQTEKIASREPERIKALNELLLKRIEIVAAPATGPEKLAKLSEVELLNKYNPSLSRDEVFDPVTFNALKYNFQFFSSVVQKYRVDGTDYVIVIHPLSN